MTMYQFPNGGQRIGYRAPALAGSALASVRGAQGYVYEDEDCTILAVIRHLDETVIAGSLITVDEESLLPFFLGPDEVTRLYFRYADGSTVTHTLDADISQIINDQAIDLADQTVALVDEMATRAAADAAMATAIATVTISSNNDSFPVILVTDYGAVGDGIADDTAAIQAAANAIPASGAVLFFSPGRYLVSAPITITKHGTSIKGSGTGQQLGVTQSAGVGTRIEIASGFSGSNVFLIQSATPNVPVYGVHLADFTIDGQNNGTAVDAVHLRSNRCHVERLHVHRMTGNGIRLHGYATWAGDSASWNTYDSTIEFCEISGCAATGVFFDAGSADCHLVSTIMWDNYDNIMLKGASQQIVSCHTYNATRHNIFFNGGGSRTKITACKIEGSGQHAINIDSTIRGYSDIQITGNGLSTNGDSADNTYDHIYLGGPSGNGISRTTIVGNNFGWKSSQTPNKPRYGVNLSGSAVSGTVLASNAFAPTASFGTSQINVSGSPAVAPFIRGNSNVADNPPLLTVKNQNTALAVRPTIDFVGAGVVATDDSGNAKTVVTIAGATSSGTPGIWTPADHGFLAWSIDPAVATQTSTLTTVGISQVIKIKLSATNTVAGFAFAIATAAGAMVSGQNFGAFYNASKVLLGTTLDQSTAWTTTGVKQANFVAASTGSLTNLVAGYYYIVFWMNWTSTNPALRGGVNSSVVNANLNAAGSRFATADTGLTTVAPTNLGTFTAGNPSWWAAIY